MEELEIISIIGRHVMGWKILTWEEAQADEDFKDAPYLYLSDNVLILCPFSETDRSWNPVWHERDCMEAWDQFSSGKITTCLEHKEDDTWEVTIIFNDHVYTAKHVVRRVAMCECMVRALGGLK